MKRSTLVLIAAAFAVLGFLSIAAERHAEAQVTPAKAAAASPTPTPAAKATPPTLIEDPNEIEQPFTGSKADLNDALDNLFIEGGQTAVIDAVYLAVENVDEYEKSHKPEDRKRRAIILVSDGEDRNSYYNEKQLSELLRESEVQIFVIGFVDDLSKDSGVIGKSPQGKSKAFL